MSKKAILLFSGGLDSTTLLFYARSKGYEVNCLIFDYGQKHSKEVAHAKGLAEELGANYEVVEINLPWKGSALLDENVDVPQDGLSDSTQIPSTYVPGRNIIFLSHALSYAEVIGAEAVFIGANAVDYSGYPDCRPEFLDAYQQVAATGLANNKIKINAPLVKKTKADIVRLGLKLGVPYKRTWSCYVGGDQPCLKCESCLLRIKGFEDAGSRDPLL